MKGKWHFAIREACKYGKIFTTNKDKQTKSLKKEQSKYKWEPVNFREKF